MGKMKNKTKNKMKTRKTAAKRFKKTKPRGGKGAEYLHERSGKRSGRTGMSTRQKNRVLPSEKVSESDKKTVARLVQ